jgi:hypothetical protein
MEKNTEHIEKLKQNSFLANLKKRVEKEDLIAWGKGFDSKVEKLQEEKDLKDHEENLLQSMSLEVAGK